MQSARRAALVAAIVLAVAANASAHRLDELLQAARIGIASDRVDLELDLTPGIAVSQAITGEIDRDRDGVFSEVEQRAFVARVLAAVQMTVDGHAVALSSTSMRFPDVADLPTGNAAISIHAAAPLPVTTTGRHRLHFNNRYDAATSVYLANALVPDTDRIAVNAQHRDGVQSALAIDYTVSDAGDWLATRLIAVGCLLIAGFFGVAWKLTRSPRARIPIPLETGQN